MKLLNNILSSSALITTTLLLSTPLVSAHGVVYRMFIDGKEYMGNMPNASPQPSVIRQVSEVGPVKGAANPDMKCGLNAKPASDVAQANPGSALQFDWRGPSLTPWPHQTGPLMTYMASCGSVTCDKFDPTGAEWFLIDRQGPASNGTWAQANLPKGGMASAQIPSNLKAGNYMVRHEIISLQNAVAAGGAEFYPSCTQLNVGGSQTGTPQQSDLVNFPGAYKDTDPGITDPDVYNPGAPYTFPGPNVASFISGSSSSGSSSGGSSNSGSSSGSNNTTSPGGNGNNGNNPGSGNNGNYPNNGTNSGSGNNGNYGNNTSSGSGSSSGTCRLRRKPNSTSGNPSNNTGMNPSGNTPNSNNNATSNNNTTSDSGSDGYNKRALGVLFHRRQLKSQPRPLSRIMRDFFYRSGERIH